MVKLKYLKIEKYRNVKPGTELHFRDSLNVALGRNGTGKTTLLNLIVQILNWDFSNIQDESASLEYGLQTFDLNIVVHFHSTKNQVSLEGISDTQYNALLTLGMLPQDSQSVSSLSLKIARAAEEPWTIHTQGTMVTLTKQGKTHHIARRDRVITGQDTLASILLALVTAERSKLTIEAFNELLNVFTSMQPSLRRFDESLSYFDKIIEQDLLSAKPSTDNDNGRYFSVIGDGPSSFASALATTLDKNPDADELGIGAEDGGQTFLHRIVELLGFSTTKVRFQLTEKMNEPSKLIRFGKLQFSFTKRDGSIVSHSLLSYGQKRLLAFFYYLATYPTSVVADELVNGMHHEWIEACIKELGERQAFLTSQNPLLLDYLTFESAEEVRASFVLCRTEFHENREQLVWENMTAEDSEGFFKGYQVAIQHVSELLRTRGLW